MDTFPIPFSPLLFFAKWTQPDFKKLAKNTRTAQFITIPYSHYVEMARWSLQIKGKHFVEQGYAPGLHVLPVLAARAGVHLSTTSYVRTVDEKDSCDAGFSKDNVHRKEKARSTAVPLLVMPDGTVRPDSWSIVKESGFEPLPEDLFKLYDEQLGPLARHVAYAHYLLPHNHHIINGFCYESMGWLGRILWGVGMNHIVFFFMRLLFKPTNEVALEKSRQHLIAVFAKLDERVSHRKGRYLHGDTLSLEDIVLCSLGGVLMWPDRYAEGRFARWSNMAMSQDQRLREDVMYWRSTVTGRYIMDVYATSR